MTKEQFETLETAKEYIADLEGSNGGALLIQPVLARYVGTGSVRNAIFTVVLPKALDGLDDGTYNGITIRIKVCDVTIAGNGTNFAGNQSADGSYFLSVVGNKEITGGYSYYGKSGTTNSDPYTSVTKDEWITWNITAEQLAALGYTDGATELTFAIANPTGNQNRGHRINTYLDYIEYYNA